MKSNFINSTFDHLPVRRDDIDRLKIPFMIAVTPFGIEQQIIPETPYNFNSAPICKSCKSAASNRMIKCPDNISYLCQICSFKNYLQLDKNLIENSSQFNSSIFDSSFPDENLIPIPMKSLLIIEKSTLTSTSNLFLKIINNLKKLDKTFQFQISVILTNNGIIYPNINHLNKKFSLSFCYDIENFILPPINLLFFDLNTELELFHQYLNYLIEIPDNLCTTSISNLINLIINSYKNQNVHTVLCTSTIEIGLENNLKEYEEICLLNNIHFDFFFMIPSNIPPIYFSLNNFSISNNSHITIFSQDEINSINNEIIQRLINIKYSQVLILCFHNSNLDRKSVV